MAGCLGEKCHQAVVDNTKKQGDIGIINSITRRNEVGTFVK